uniref:Protein ripply3 n=1 Tax=Eptatretus burgeri TaxID=7764 RepID=A0A8C4QJ33_EPTBU
MTCYEKHQLILVVPPPPLHRLLWPRSKSFDYLYEDGQRLLACFPVQATIAFYESESEDEIEGETEEEKIMFLHETSWMPGLK